MRNSVKARGLARTTDETRQLSETLARGTPQVDLNAFVVSASAETRTKSFVEWAGGERVTLAIVFTDIVGSTALGNEIGDEGMNEILKAHFEQGRRLLAQYDGWEVKTIGDAFMAVFHSTDKALDFAVSLHSNSGHPRVRVRAGIHVGEVQVQDRDISGETVNCAKRVVDAAKGAEIWLSDQAKWNIETLRAEHHSHLKWERHDGVPMKGFPGTFILWSLAGQSGVVV
ncbi:MAG: adenylate/guanylate cyclase domain-containing protein [Phycisphaerae bacterium]|nr:adenylate/guanylate cyclase domain-containing protein [Phycisphaerae bacterium]